LFEVGVVSLMGHRDAVRCGGDPFDDVRVIDGEGVKGEGEQARRFLSAVPVQSTGGVVTQVADRAGQRPDHPAGAQRVVSFGWPLRAPSAFQAAEVSASVAAVHPEPFAPAKVTVSDAHAAEADLATKAEKKRARCAEVRGRPRRLLALVFVIASVTTAVLSLDATVVLLTPVVIGAAARVGARPKPHAYACTHLQPSGWAAPAPGSSAPVTSNGR